MPHYKDGTLARVGDQVRGASYNRGGHIEEGVLVAITSQGDVCNARFYFPFLAINPQVTAPKPNVDYVTEGLDYGEIRAFERLVSEPLPETVDATRTAT